jgi:regulator of protease activity HflC (stomatin/prohibitin superfamily)
MDYIYMSLAIFILLAVISVMSTRSVVRIQQSEVMIIERLGRFNRLLRPGLHVYIPFWESPRFIIWRFIEHDPEGNISYIHRKISRIDLKETVYDFAWQEVITRDNVILKINALLFYQVTDAEKVAYEINNLPFAIEELARAALRSLIGTMTLDETLSSRTNINKELRIILDDAASKWGVKVSRIELQEIDPPAKIREAMEAEMRAERNSRAMIIEADAEKKSQILRSQGEAFAIDCITKMLIGSKIDPTQYMIAMRYIETFKEMVSGKDNKVVYLPFEATAMLSALGGIKDIFKDMKPSPES